MKNGNSKWSNLEKLKISQLNECESFKDLRKGATEPKGHTKIPCHFTCDVKMDGRHKSRIVAGRHRTDAQLGSVYSGVVSLHGTCIVTLRVELNDLDLWSTDVGNTCLESVTHKKVCFVVGPEFGELAGHLLIIVKEQCGLRSSGKR